jgi:hypothetical protein
MLASLLLTLVVPSQLPKGFIALHDAVQKIYQGGVPHTDRHGNRLMEYDSTKSYLPLILYDAQLPCNTTESRQGQTCLPVGFNASIYEDANFTGVLPYQSNPMSSYMKDRPAGFGGTSLQVIREGPSLIQTPPGPLKCPPSCHGRQENEPKVYKDHPNLLGWYLREEPTGSYWEKNMSSQFEVYKEEFAKVRAEDPEHPIFILDCPWITAPATSWWVKWNTYGDVSSHDNYPFDYRSTSLAHINGDGGGIPQTVGLAVSSNNQSKPVWLCVQTFEGGAWLMPSVREMRGQLYTGIIAGATGIIYFAMDSYVTRAGDVFGFGPAALLNESYFDASTTDPRPLASPSLLTLAAQLWEGTAALNTELLSILPVIFAPTSPKSSMLSVSFSGSNTTDTPIRVMWKALPDGREYLLAVNVDKGRVTARFDFGLAESGRISSMQTLFETGRCVAVNASVFEDSFEEMGVHVYEIV